MKKNAIIRIVIYSLAIFILGSILLACMADELYLSTHSNAIEPLLNARYESYSSEIRNIEIQWVCGDISIKSDDTVTGIEICEFAYADSEHTSVFKQSGQTLYIGFSEEDFELINIGFGDNKYQNKDLTILVPDEWTGKEINIETASAKVSMTDIQIADFHFDGASGNCLIANCAIGEMDIDTASGNVTFSGTLDALDCDAASANCSIEVFNIPSSIEMDSMSGDLELVLPTDAGFICKLDTMSGSFDSDFTFKVHGDTYVCGSGDCKINVSALSGDVSILKGIE